MASTIQLQITNIAQIRAAFNKAPALMTKRISVAIKQAIFFIQARSMTKTPVLTGRLRASTYTRFEPLKGEVGTKTNYDFFVHEGTKFMPGRPYLRRAVDETNGQIDDLFTNAAQEVLNDIGNMT